MTFKSKIGWPEQPNNLPTYQGDRPGRNQVRKAEMKAQGMKGIRRVDWKDEYGNSYTMNTRNGFPEVVQTGSQKIETPITADAVRGFVAHVPAAINAARFSPYSLSVPDPKYRVYEHTYTVLPFETPYNVPTSDTTDWFDVISFYRGKILINGKEMSSLRITSPPTDALPWLIPRFAFGEAKYGDYDTNGYEKRVFAVYRDSVHCWMPGTLGTTASLNNPTARPYKALMCGAKIEADTHKAFISQFAFTGETWDSFSGGWAITTAEVSMLLTPPYLTKVDAGFSSERTYCELTAQPAIYISGHVDPMVFPPAEVGLTGNAVLGTAGTNYQLVWYPATGVFEHDVEGYEYGNLSADSPYSGNVSETFSAFGKTVEVNCSGSFLHARKVGSAQNDQQIFTVNPSPAPTYTDIRCYNNDTTSWDPLQYGTRGNATLGLGSWQSGGVLSDWYRDNSDVEFSITLGGVPLVSGSATRHKSYGNHITVTKTPLFTDVVSGGAAYYTMIVQADMVGVPTEPAIAKTFEVANTFVGQSFIWQYDYVYFGLPHYTATPTAMAPRDDSTLNWTTKDYLLFDDANSCYISVDSTFTGAQYNGSSGSAKLLVRLTVSTPAGDATQTLFETTITYLDMLPEVELVASVVHVPPPQLRFIFAPKYREQGDFKGAAYTTAAEEANGVVPAYLFNFVLKLDTYYAIGDADADAAQTINFIPCNLIEMLYAYVYSSQYGIAPYARYPVENVPRYNSFQASLFSNQWRVNYRDGAMVDWLDALGGPYLTETMTELYRV